MLESIAVGNWQHFAVGNLWAFAVISKFPFAAPIENNHQFKGMCLGHTWDDNHDIKSTSKLYAKNPILIQRTFHKTSHASHCRN